MTERQKNKVDEIIKLTISSFEVADVFPESIARDLVISLAKVFNIDITKEKADYIVDEIIKNEPIQYGSGYEALAYIIERIGWITAEYFDSEKNASLPPKSLYYNFGPETSTPNINTSLVYK